MKFCYNVYRNYVNEIDRDIFNDFWLMQYFNYCFVYVSDISVIYKFILVLGILVLFSICIIVIIFLFFVFMWQNNRNLLLQRVFMFLYIDIVNWVFVFNVDYYLKKFCFLYIEKFFK